MFYLYGFLRNNEDLLQSFGFNNNSVIISFLLFNFVFSPISHVIRMSSIDRNSDFLEFMMNLWSRHNEFQADAFSVKLGYGDELTSGTFRSFHL